MAQGSEVLVDPEMGTVVLNDTSVSTSDVMTGLMSQHPEIASLMRWGNSTQAVGRGGGIFQRDRYVTPAKIFDQFRVALDASESDDVVSGVAEMTESLAFNAVVVECLDEDEQDIWNQILEDLDLEARLREMWRELFVVSQCYVASLWETKSYKVRGRTGAGNKKKRTFNVNVPTHLTVLDPLKVLPVGNFMFGQERLVYIANRSEVEDFDNVLAGKNSSDLIVTQLIKEKYTPSTSEKKFLQENVDSNLDNLYLLNPKRVFRHCATRPGYTRFATVRMKSVFELLDIKQQLRQMDRAHLIGASNFIVLVKKGSDQMPAQPVELNALANQVKSLARVPIIIGDHRLAVEIVTPKTDVALQPEKYNTLDSRITARLFQLFNSGNYAAGAKGDDSIKLARMVARGMEARRGSMGLTLMKHLLIPAFNDNAALTSRPVLNFKPRRIALDFDPNVLNFMQELRDRGDLSRETLLSEMDITQHEEANRRERERENWDDIFEPPLLDMQPSGKVGTPSANPKAAGRKGGRGGGSNRNSYMSNPGRGPAVDKVD
jgi:hypothetical protein